MSLPFVGLLALLSALLQSPAMPQAGMSASARQRRSLEPLVESVALRLELHIPSVRASVVERRVRKALANQVPAVVKDNLDALIRELVIEGRDLGRKDRDRVGRDLCVDLGMSLPALASELVPLQPKEKIEEDSDFLLIGFASEHAACLLHNKEAIAKIEDRNGEPLEASTKKGLGELAAYYARIFPLKFGIERPPKDFRDLLTEAMTTSSTRRARLAVVAKLRHLLRPSTYEEFEAETLAEKIDAETLVEERIREALADSAIWERLRLDHEAMLKDPKAMRRSLKDR